MSTYSLKFEDNGDTIRCDAKNDGFSILEMIGMLEIKKDDLMRQLKDKNEFTHKRISVPPDDVLDVIEDVSKPKYDHWIDNADSYICPVCGEEVRDPGKYPGCKCPNCGFQDERETIMKIDIPYDIGDPILVIDYCQHDGYYIDCRPFRYADIGNLENVFKTRKEAEAALDKLIKGNKQ